MSRCLNTLQNQISPDIGKILPPILDLCLDHFELDRNDILLVGDNLETDIKLGQNANIETVFVQTGVHTKEDIKRLNIHPTYVIDHLMELPALIFLIIIMIQSENVEKSEQNGRYFLNVILMCLSAVIIILVLLQSSKSDGFICCIYRKW